MNASVRYPVQAGAAVFDGTHLAVIAGPCVLEDAGLGLEVAQELVRISETVGVPVVFKSSYAKDNRSSGDSFRGPGMTAGLKLLESIKQKTGLPVLSDIHLPNEAALAAEVLDILQIPAFLCRQTSLLEAAGATGKAVNIKKGQFMAPQDMTRSAEKVRRAGSPEILLTERGSSFGYHNLVVDMRSFPLMAESGCPVIHDMTHSLQLPGSGKETGGQREFAMPLARAALAAGAQGLFLEVHPNPEKAKSDSTTQLPLQDTAVMLGELKRLWKVLREPAGEGIKA